jgi:cell wall-associated protease
LCHLTFKTPFLSNLSPLPNKLHRFVVLYSSIKQLKINPTTMRIKKCVAILAFTLPIVWASAQSKAPDNWFNKDLAKDNVAGMSTEEAYSRLKAKGKKGQTIIVAVLDSGVDYKHEDLKEIMWVNPGEKPNDGIDNDGNGYIDDIHGWNFIGGKNGENVHHDTYELTREYKRLTAKYQGKELTSKGVDKADYAYFQKVKEAFEEKRGELEQQKAGVDDFFGKAENAFAAAAKALNKAAITKEDLPALKNDPSMKESIGILERCFAQEITPETIGDSKKEASEYFDGGLMYGLNPDYNPRTIVGDVVDDLSNRFYGNNDVQGPDAMHGTHVAGIIAAKRNNKIGMDGVAENVRIMSVRCVPDGDERDKDVANAIRYAVDNGASILNMSFGKGYSPDKEYVDAAIRYALDHDVLLVHAAGNDSEDNDSDPNFPNDKFKKSGWFKAKNAGNWMEIGALSWKSGEKRPATFSNFGKKNVDLFAPGVAIYATVPDNKYQNLQGTSMASPAAAGVAAILRSHYPDLNAKQIKEVMESSVVAQDGKVYKPGTTELVSFSELCTTGGTVNADKAVVAAEKVKGKKVKNARWRMAGEAAGRMKVVTP